MRLAARLLHNRKDVKVSSAVFGAVSASDAEPGPSEANLNLSSAVSVSNRPSKYTKRKPDQVPKIKHTKASKLRIIKANPLLEARGLITLSNTAKKEHNNSNLPRKSVPEPQQREPATSAKKSIIRKESVAANSRSCPRNYLARRSLSAAAFTRKRTNERFGTTPLRRTLSVDDEGQNGTVHKQRNDNDEARDGIFSLPLTPRNFQTPQRARSGILAKSSGKKRVTFSNIHSPSADEMREKLSNWLLKRGKSLGEFHHLHCFGIHSSNLGGNIEKKKVKRKQNIHNQKSSVNTTSENETSLSSANETFCLEESSPEEDKENAQNSNSSIRNNSDLIKDVMADLLNVIQIGYPWEQCEEWLMMIRRNSPQINEQPIYWECLAGIEAARGDFRSAVDCYERAIVRGASPTQVGDSLENLMEKFNLLNLNCYSENDVTSRSRTPRKQVLDARNVFKSSVIKFALQQKALKSLSTNLGVEAAALHYVVTPVRRSTRSSLSQYRLTPHTHCVSSINDLEPDVQDSMLFQPNCALEH
ncbi:uncharacterized protein [Periplaneta americana]